MVPILVIEYVDLATEGPTFVSVIALRLIGPLPKTTSLIVISIEKMCSTGDMMAERRRWIYGVYDERSEHGTSVEDCDRFSGI